MNTTCPVETLKALHDAAKADLDAAQDDTGNVLVSRLGSLTDAVLAHEALSADGLRLQAAMIRQHANTVENGEPADQIMRLAAIYAERLATVPTARPTPDQQTALRLADTTMHLLDALGALRLAIIGVEDDADRRSLLFVHEKASEIASSVDDMARELHHGGAS